MPLADVIKEDIERMSANQEDIEPEGPHEEPEPTIEDLRALNIGLARVNHELIQKVFRQRMELRRLNRRIRDMWDGVRFAVKANNEQRLVKENHELLLLIKRLEAKNKR